MYTAVVSPGPTGHVPNPIVLLSLMEKGNLFKKEYLNNTLSEPILLNSVKLMMRYFTNI